MNERILEIAKQVGAHWNHGDFNMGSSVEFQESDLEKFAELIIRECIGCCEQVISDPVPESVDTWLNGGSQCIDEIKEHFGVKE